MHEQKTKIEEKTTSKKGSKNIELFSKLQSELANNIVGMRSIFRQIVICFLCDGHVLVEGVPGIAKTSIVREFAKAIRLSFSRIQFSPDLLPADITGTMIYNQKKGEFYMHKGPIFASIIMADEINRAPSKVQSALLEAMQEKQITVWEKSYPLPQPFMVLATQNPLEQEGTYPLPEAQLDRFMMKVTVGYPSKEEELKILQKKLAPTTVETKGVWSKAEINSLKKEIAKVYVDDSIAKYIVNIARATRNAPFAKNSKELVLNGVSPRAAIFLLRAAKANAYLHGMDFVSSDDVKEVASNILSHRIILSYQSISKGMTPEIYIRKILEFVESP